MSDPADTPPPDAVSVLNTGFYTALREVAGRMFTSERAGHTLQPTAAVNEACIRLMASGLPQLPLEQQLAIAGRVLRQVLIDHARAHKAQKRGGGDHSGPLLLDIEPDLIAPGPAAIEFDRIHLAIDRLASISPRQAEVLMLRIFSGLTMDQVAAVVGVSKRSAENDWTVARAWLRRELHDADGAAPP